MHLRTIAYSLLAAISMIAVASAQQYQPNGVSPQPGGNVQPDQPVRPQDPTLDRRGPQPGMQQPAQQQPPPPPFTLTPPQEADRDRALTLWQQHNRRVKTLDSRIKRWRYDSVFGQPDVARFIELGVLRYAAPDKGVFRIDTAEINHQEVPIDPSRAEHWVCDGKSIIEFSHVKKQVTVHKLPPESQGKAIADSPLPFLFCSDAETMKKRYFIRLVVPPPDAPPQSVCLEAYPRFQPDAANFHHAQFIVTSPTMEPWALNLIQPNGKDSTVYRFFEVVINDPMPRIFRGGNPFQPPTPFGWQKIVEEPQGAHAQRPPIDGRR